MKFKNELYKELKIPPTHPFHGCFSFEPRYGQLVTSIPDSQTPIHDWFYFKPAYSSKLVTDLFQHLNVKPGKVVLDPFCGIGTTILAAKQTGRSAYGFDILPLAVFVSNTKLQDNYDLLLLKKEILRVLKSKHQEEVKASTDYYLVKGFSRKNLVELTSLKNEIEKTEDDKIRNFLLLGLLATMDQVSYAKKDGGFLRFSDAERRKKVESLSLSKLLENKYFSMFADLRNLSLLKFIGREEKVDELFWKVQQSDARKLPLESETIDATICSPPYLNRFDYTRVYALELSFLFTNDDQLKELRKRTIRSHVEAKAGGEGNVSSLLLDNAMFRLSKEKLSNPQIPEMIRGYFEDLYLCISEIHRVSRTHAPVAIVVGNSRFSGVHIETDCILCEIANDLGFDVRKIVVAKQRGSSAQQVDRYGEIPLRESICILRKQ